MQNPKLLTLATVTQEALTRETVSTIRSAFQRLLHRSYFRERILGGLYVIEIKLGEAGWNIHLHALIDAPYLDQRTISNAWHQITGDSYIVDIRRAFSARAGLRYILKYMLKPPVLNGRESVYDHALKGTRLVQPFGVFYRAGKEKSVLTCPRCARNSWISEFEIRDRRESAGRDPRPPYPFNPPVV
jgi:hypothetical protein